MKFEAFETKEFGRIQIMELNDETFFRGADVMEAIGRSRANVRNASVYVKDCDTMRDKNNITYFNLSGIEEIVKNSRMHKVQKKGGEFLAFLRKAFPPKNQEDTAKTRQSEIDKIKSKIKDLELALEKLSHPASLREILKRDPITGTSAIEADRIIRFYYSRFPEENIIYKELESIGRKIHLPQEKYLENENYKMERQHTPETYPTYEEMTQDELDITAQLVDEIVAVWDKFYKQAHKGVDVLRKNGTLESILISGEEKNE